MTRITTARLALSALEACDLEAFHHLNTDPAVRRYLFDDRIWSLEETRTILMAENLRLWAAAGRGLFGVREGTGGALVGWIGFWYFHEPPVLEIGYALAPGVRGRGYATEAARGLMAWAAAVHGDREFRASTDAPNEDSLRVLAHLGFREVRRSPGVRHETVHLHRVGLPAPGRAGGG